jgi:4-alpha-glucanotransferase
MLSDRRSSGILLPVYALPGKGGVGTFGAEAISFIDFLVQADQRVWQILPLGPSGAAYSPYKSRSAFAGDPVFISLEALVAEGLLKKDHLVGFESNNDKFNYSQVMERKLPLLEKSFKHALKINDSRFWRQFNRFENLHAWWLDEYALFAVLAEKFGTANWAEWEKPLRDREENKIKLVRKEHSRSIRFQKFLQFIFLRQWAALRHYAEANHVSIFGDLPIFVAYESADVWAYPECFMLDDDKAPESVAGVPPDYFSKTGQLWGNPQYNWKVMRKTGYNWWIQRLAWNLKLFDLVRIDHFRGLEASWSIPAGSPDASAGSWVKAPGRAILKRVRNRSGLGSLIAEDLGYITPAVEYLRDEFNLPGMRVLQFAFEGKENNAHLPHQYIRNSVAYTGTHDNDTLKGWYGSLDRKTKSVIRQYVHSDGRDIVWDMIRSVWASSSNLAITTMQDLLSLGTEARTNHPGKEGSNWAWRLPSDEYPPSITSKLSEITHLYGRS